MFLSFLIAELRTSQNDNNQINPRIISISCRWSAQSFYFSVVRMCHLFVSTCLLFVRKCSDVIDGCGSNIDFFVFSDKYKIVFVELRPRASSKRLNVKSSSRNNLCKHCDKIIKVLEPDISISNKYLVTPHLASLPCLS